MKQETLTILYELIDEIKKQDKYQKLLLLRKEVNNNIEIQSMIETFNKNKTKFEEVSKYGKYHPDLKKVQKELSESKNQLFLNDVVKEIKQLEKDIQHDLDKISREISQSISNKIRFPNELGLINKH